MKRKRHISKRREVYKWKARLNFDGSKQVKGVNYWRPMHQWHHGPPSGLYWPPMLIIPNWHMKQIDFVLLAYTQADDDMYMKIPQGFNIPGSDPDEYVLKLLQKNLYYRQKQAGRGWNKHLVSRLKKEGFKQSNIDECIFYKGKVFTSYTPTRTQYWQVPTKRNFLIPNNSRHEARRAALDLTVEGDIGTPRIRNISPRNTQGKWTFLRGDPATSWASRFLGSQTEASI
jgi:hypothetical protein